LRSPKLFPFLPAALAVQRVDTTADRVTVSARARAADAACPLCGGHSRRLHSRYRRCLRDLPWQGRQVRIELQVRRFRCADAGCPRRVFAEPMPEVAAPRRQRTRRLAEIQRCVGLAAGGEKGARLATRLAMPASGDTLLRLIRATPIERAPTPKIIGIDDWGAWRRGRRWGTIVVDLERHRPIDLLPDREAETVAAWLRDHPGVEVVARDRAGAYADGIRAGAPDATQVADRWHLLRKLGEVLADILERHHRDLRTAAKAAAEAGADAPPPPTEPSGPSPVAPPRGDRHAGRRARFDEAVTLHEQGWPVKRIARTLNMDPKTVRGWLRSGRLPTWTQHSRGSTVDRHAEHLRRRWNEGCRNAAQLWREIRECGFRGRLRTVQRWVARFRDSDPASRSPRRSRAAWKAPGKRRAAWLVVAASDALDATERRFVEVLLAASSDLARVVELARRFRAMVRDRQEAALDPWLSAAKGTALAGFAAGLARDLAAVRAALSLPWSTGPVEGQISHLKTIKRTMSGRASFNLLRSRMLEAA
jgi:transposase